MLNSKTGWCCLALCCAGVLSASSLWAAPQYGGRLSSRLGGGGRSSGSSGGLYSRGGNGNGGNSGAAASGGYSQGAYSQNGYSQATPLHLPSPSTMVQNVGQSVITKVVPEPLQQLPSVVKKVEAVAAAPGVTQQIARATVEKAVDVGAEATKKVVVAVAQPVAAEVKTVSNAAFNVVREEKESIEQEIVRRQQELKALQERLAEKGKAVAKQTEEAAAEELKQAMEIVRKTRLEAQKKLEEEKRAIEAEMKQVAQKAEALALAAERKLVAEVKEAGAKLVEGLDKLPVAEAAITQAAAERLAKLERNQELAMLELQKLAAERAQQQEQMKKMLEQMATMLAAIEKDAKP